MPKYLIRKGLSSLTAQLDKLVWIIPAPENDPSGRNT